jgi:hypothetical protein
MSSNPSPSQPASDASLASLTVTLRGFAAVYYARATGVALRRSEVHHVGGHVEPARLVTPAEAHALMQRDQAETQNVSCLATHGELTYHGAGPLEIDWPTLHAAALVVDAERHAVGCLGYDGISDALGGSYFPPSYESAGLAGVVRVLGAAQAIRQAAWDAVHASSRAPRGPELAACGTRTALALDHLFRALSSVGVYVYEPGTQICGVTGRGPDDTVQVTGLRWLRGATVDSSEHPPTMREVHAFLAEGAGRRTTNASDERPRTSAAKCVCGAWNTFSRTHLSYCRAEGPAPRGWPHPRAEDHASTRDESPTRRKGDER